MKRFKELVRETAVEPDVPSQAALTYKEKPNKEPMPKLKEETDTSEKVEMVQSQLHFIKYACEEILEYIDDGGEVEEWYQVKVAKSFSEFESLHAFIEGESRRTGMKEEVELNEEGWIGNKAKWKKTVQQTHGSDVTFRLYNHPGQPGQRSTEAFNTKGKQVGVYQHHNKMGMVQPNLNKEEVEQIDELSIDTLKSYTSKAREDAQSKTKEWHKANKAGDKETTTNLSAKMGSRGRSIGKANAKISQKQGKIPFSIPKHIDVGRLTGESVEQIDELSNELLGRYKDKAVISHGEAEKAKNYKLSDKRFSGVVKATNKQFDNFRKKPFKFGEEKEPPFDPDPPKKKQVVPGKYGSGYSTARHLARQALKKQTEKLKPVKESLEESRKTEIVKEIMKKKKNEKENTDTFQKEPVLSSEIVKA